MAGSADGEKGELEAQLQRAIVYYEGDDNRNDELVQIMKKTLKRFADDEGAVKTAESAAVSAAVAAASVAQRFTAKEDDVEKDKEKMFYFS